MKKRLTFTILLVALLMLMPVQVGAACKHTYGKWTTDKAATYFATGKKSRECNKCGHVQTSTIPKKALVGTRKEIVTRIQVFLKATREYNLKKMDFCFSAAPKIWLPEPLRPIIKELNREYFSYKLINVKITGKAKAEVQAIVYYPDCYWPFTYALTEYMNYVYAHPKAKSSAYMSVLAKSIQKQLRYYEIAKEKKTITFKLIKSGKYWKIAKAGIQIENLTMANYASAYDDFFAGY